MKRPCDLYYMDASETVFASEIAQRVSVWDKAGNLLERLERPNAHGLFGDSRGDLYLAHLRGQNLGKLVKVP